MARIRSIKPDFWTSEQVVDCSPLARLMFIGLLNFCDDAGIHPANERRIKMSVFPGDDIDHATIRRLIDELAGVGLIELYEVENVEYLLVTGFAKHQRVEKPSYKHPKPVGSQQKIASKSANGRRKVVDGQPPEWSGVEGSGVERKGDNNQSPPPSSGLARADEPTTGGKFEEKPRSELMDQAKALRDRLELKLNLATPVISAPIIAWLQAGGTPELIELAIDDVLRGKGDWKPDTIKFFDKAVRRAIEDGKTAAVSARSGGRSPASRQSSSASDDDDQWAGRLKIFKEKGFWLERYGPKPGEPGCLVPKHLLEGKTDAA